MASKVFFWNLRTSRKMPYELKLKKLLKSLGIGQILEPGQLVALKIHFGEKGTTGFISPLWIRPIIEFLKKVGVKPFLTDTNTLYVGERGESVSHLLQAARHGFDPNLLGAPIIIADGLKSNNERCIEFKGTHFNRFYLAGDIVDADYLIFLSHFKGHELAGFGGALKNVAMGCATRQGKMQQHCGFGPKIIAKLCQGCAACVEVCKPKALQLVEGKVTLDPENCVGCAACLLACKTKALTVNWKVDIKIFLERMIEYAAAVLLSRKKPSLHINFVLRVSPDCDCVGFTDAPICPDLGILGSYDPVALDQACLDLVNASPPLHPSCLPEDIKSGEDKFRAIHPHVRGDYALEYAQKLGLGNRDYELVKV
jgi:hypothetical protein